MSIRTANKGFTLIELLVVMGIIGVLAALLFTNFSGVRERARDTKRKNDLNQVKNALRLFYNDYQQYPAGTGTTINGCGSSTNPPSTACAWGTDSFSAGSPAVVYMNQLPKDPLTGATEYSYTLVDSDHFLIKAVLENSSDPAIVPSQTRCGAISPGATDYFVCAD